MYRFKIIVAILVNVSVFNLVQSQSTDYWVNDAQTYYRILNVNDGIVRITASALVGAGVPLSAFAPQNVQVFYRGVEIPIYIKGETQGAIEYVEFVAEKNNGWLDTGMFVTSINQINPHVSLVTDSSAYFFTWNSSFSNLRYQTFSYVESPGNEIINHGRRTSIYAVRSQFFEDEIDPELGATEGWFSLPLINLGQSTTRTVSLPGIRSEGNVYCSTAVAGVNNATTQTGYNHHLQIKHGTSILCDTLFRGYQAINKSFMLNASEVGGSLVINYSSINDQSVLADRMGVAWLSVDYPANFTLSANSFASFAIEPSSNTRQLYFQGLTLEQQPIVYESNNGFRLVSTYTENGWGITLPPSDIKLQLNVSASPSILSSGVISLANMQITSFSSDYIVVSHSSLMSAAQQFASYRGGFAVDIEQLYNRYAYGIKRHPLAIRYFLQSYISKGNAVPTYLFLIGKGINMNDLRSNPSLIPYNLIPVPGSPSSDMLITSRLTRSGPIPEVMVGRLAASNPQQVLDYLLKVQEHAQRTPTLGAKNVLHFGGGANITEQTTFANYLKNYETIIQDTLYGAFVSTFLKNSSAPIVITQSDSVKRKIENGAMLLTFYGHSWTGGFDQNIEEPEMYNNSGMYPLIIANSCSSGNIFQTSTVTTSEKWVLIPQRGAVAFMASVDLGYPSYLNQYTQRFYENLASLSYGESYGKSVLQTVTELMISQSSYIKSTCLEFIFHGDPAVTPVSWPLPDPMLPNNSLSLQPINVTTAIDSFGLEIIVSNVGRTLNQPLQNFAERLLPNGNTQERTITINKIYYQDTLMLYFPVDRYSGVGQNRIVVTVDKLNEIEELSEFNNQQTIQFPISSTEIFPIYPQKFGLINQSHVVLKSSTGDPFETKQQYQIQLDTVPEYSSLFLNSTLIESEGGVIEWAPSVSFENNKPYFWRVSKKTTTAESEWNESTFSINSEKSGWCQSSKNQFLQNEFRFMEYSSGLTMQYVNTPRVLSCYNIGSASGTGIDYINYDIDGNGDYGSCIPSPSVVIAVIDSLTLLPWSSDRGDYGHVGYPTCGSRPRRYFTFTANDAGRDAMRDFLLNIVDDGNYVLVYSVQNAAFEQWDNSHFAAFEMLGSTLIRTVPNNFPYIFIGRKGDSNFAEEVIGENAYSTITLEKTLVSNFHYGSIITPYIGPAKEWRTLHWSPRYDQIDGTDSISLKVFTQSASSSDSLVSILSLQDTVYDLSFLNHQNIHYVKLEYFTYDLEQKTPVAPRLFEVEYLSYPELALNPKGGVVFHDLELNEGDSLVFGVELRNVSPVNSGSFPIKYTCRSVDAKVVEEKVVLIDSIPALGSVFDTVKFDSRNRRGINQIQIEANYSTDGAVTFPEPFTFNNIGWQSFTVKPDDREPLLEVYFDGRYIMNQEIVSSRPEVKIVLTDENQFISLNDTSLLEIWLTQPESNISERVWFAPAMAANELLWQPAAEQNNECTLIWHPQFNIDGMYDLRVRAVDPSGNQAGTDDYRIQFEIVNRSTITNLLNYPNPFSTSTRFVFTITGHIIPEELRIQIFTVSGRVVRDINLSELGGIHIGQNITDYFWDGTDQFGDRLANGVYFYRVISKINGEKIEHRESGADKYFKKEFGKMYLIK